MRVHELAKELNIDSKTVIRVLKENESIGTVKNHMSSVDEDQKGVVKLGLAVAEEPFALTFTASDLDETSFDEYVDDDIKEDLHRIEPNDDNICIRKKESPIVPQGTAGTSAFSTYSDEDRLETEEELSFGQKAFAKAKSEEMTSAKKETEDHFSKLQTDAWSKEQDVWTKTKEDVRDKLEKQEVIVERPTGFWGWLKGLF